MTVLHLLFGTGFAGNLDTPSSAENQVISKSEHPNCFRHNLSIYHIWNINWRDVKKKNVVNNVAMSSLRAPWQNGTYKN